MKQPIRILLAILTFALLAGGQGADITTRPDKPDPASATNTTSLHEAAPDRVSAQPEQ
jgi:hypothetical protein